MLAFVLIIASMLGGIGRSPDEAGASVPGAAFTDTGCEGYSDSVDRLYVAGLGRSAEEAGFGYWMAEYTSGRWTFPRMADFFTKSDEFVSTYGNVTNRGFVEQLYRNVLGRQGDETGIVFWSGQMSAGMTRPKLLMRFAESPENALRSGTRPPTLGYYNEGLSSSWSCASVPDADIDLVISDDQWLSETRSRTVTGVAHAETVALAISAAFPVPATFGGVPSPLGGRRVSGTIGSNHVFLGVASTDALTGRRVGGGSIGPCNNPDPVQTRYCNTIVQLEIGAVARVTDGRQITGAVFEDGHTAIAIALQVSAVSQLTDSRRVTGTIGNDPVNLEIGVAPLAFRGRTVRGTGSPEAAAIAMLLWANGVLQ